MKEQERNLGIDLLRIISMIAIITYHLLGHGWILPLIHQTSWKFTLLTALHSLCMTGVDCFVLISGYVGVKGRFKYASVAVQWAKTWFYSVLITLVVWAFAPGEINGETWIAAFMPTVSRQYWYFTAYIGCMMLAPLICMGIRNMNAKQAALSAALLLSVFSVLNTAGGKDPFYTNSGSNTLWLVVLYTIGAYLGWFMPHRRIPAAALAAAACFSAVLLGGKLFMGERTGLTILMGGVRNDSPLVVMTAVLMTLLFSKIRIGWGKRAVSVLSAASFSVYLIHDHPLMRKFVVSRYAYHLSGLGTLTIVPGILAAAAGIYLVCTLLDMPRSMLFRCLSIRRRAAEIERRLTGGWNDEQK